MDGPRRGQYHHRMELETLSEDEDALIGMCGPLAVVVWRRITRPEAVRFAEAAGAQVLERAPAGKGATLFLVEDGATPPDGDCRRMTSEANERLAARGMVSVAGVVPRSGFTGALYRGVITGIALLSRTPYPMKVFASVPESVHWLSGQLAANGGAHLEVPEVSTALDDAFDAYRARCVNSP